MTTDICNIGYQSNIQISDSVLVYLVSGGLELDLGAAANDDEGVEEVALDARRRKVGVVGLQEDHAHDVVADVSLPLELKCKNIIWVC